MESKNLYETYLEIVDQSEELDGGEELIYENRQNRARALAKQREEARKARESQGAAYGRTRAQQKLDARIDKEYGSKKPVTGLANLGTDYKAQEKAASAKAAAYQKENPKTPTPKATPTPKVTTPTPVAKTSTPKPAPKPAAPPKDRMANASKADRMGAWAKANPKLAAAKAERDRTRGTSATTNPMMKDMKSSLPKPAATPAKRPLTTSTAPKTGAAASSTLKKFTKMNNSTDMFDLVKGHLLDEGFAETEEAAVSIMANMSEGWRTDILEFIGGQKGDGYVGHPRLGIKNPMAKKQTTTNMAPKNTGLAGRMGNRASKLEAAMKKAGMN